MPHEHETLDAEPANAVDHTPIAPEPDFIVRARRILSGDIRPDDYLPVPPEVQAEFDRSFNPETAEYFAPFRRHTLNNWTLSFYYGDIGPVLSRESELGVIVIAVGLEQMRAVLDLFPRREQRAGFSHNHAFPWQSPTPLS